MDHYFAVTTFEEFLELASDWGFSQILQDVPQSSSIQVFRHPQFIQGDWERCSHIKIGESPQSVRVSALPQVDFCLSSDDSNNSTKRRLSPGFLARRESESSTTQKIKTEQTNGGHRESVISNESEDDSNQHSYTTNNRSDELRSICLSITTSKLNISNEAERQQHSPTSSSSPDHGGGLVQRAVESATHTIVTDAIESLLRDEGHSKKTYLKHEKELSKSSLPGVIPISKQLFDNEEHQTIPPSEVVTAKVVVAETEHQDLPASPEDRSEKDIKDGE
jgi:hypothetical protein